MLTPTPQPTSAPVSYGPGPEDFPAGINPLTGLPVANPELLKTPALLISISHFPPAARPQAGLSFAPYVFEFSITGGETRFLTTFYGEEPAPEIPIQGNCTVRQGLFKQTSTLVGNRVWLDSDRDGIQEPGEPGIGGVCVYLYDAAGKKIAATTTDSNGYYGFNLSAGKSYSLEFEKPAYLDFTQSGVGDENHDSDADSQSGHTGLFLVNDDDLLQDAGMSTNARFVKPTPDAKKDPKAQVGPVRSGRLLYSYIANFFQNSCLIDAFASKEVLPLIPHCAFVTHEVAGGGYMLDIARLKAIAQENARNMASRPFNYTSNLYSDRMPAGGKPALQINEFFASLNQSGWTYDPLYQAYLRYVDTADKNTPGVLHAEVDRLTGRQLHFENIIVITADTGVRSAATRSWENERCTAGAGRFIETMAAALHAFELEHAHRVGAPQQFEGRLVVEGYRVDVEIDASRLLDDLDGVGEDVEVAQEREELEERLPVLDLALEREADHGGRVDDRPLYPVRSDAVLEQVRHVLEVELLGLDDLQLLLLDELGRVREERERALHVLYDVLLGLFQGDVEAVLAHLRPLIEELEAE